MRSALYLILLCVSTPALAQDPVLVDDSGVMRWTADGSEVALFGVNYTTPFAHAYRAHGYLDVDRKQAIDRDVAHIARLGFDAFRVHVWEREVADSTGNLIKNDHLDLYDYLVHRLSERGISTVLTPIAWWPTGYPERVPDTGSFTDPYTKGQMTTDPVPIAAQVRYVKQFVEHVNPYSGYTYRDDPNVIAMELFNEPNHPGTPEQTTGFIDTLTSAAREVGFTKPIFYNIAEGYTDDHGRAVCAAQIDGISMQWYPTSLVRGRSLGGNMLPNVDSYPTPFDAFADCADKARMVYEFDAADVPGSYIYPVMTRSFRGAGVQFATQFAYDPLAMAHANTEYQTHFVNLVHAPSKAISLMIAGEVFRSVPRRATFPAHPEGSRFGPFRVSYLEDLSEMVTDSVFIHSNTTPTLPPNIGALHRIAGVGSSPLVRYEGNGAYFLDRLDAGVWRLEVYPDVAWVHDPYTRSSLERRAVEVIWSDRDLSIRLPDLGPEFTATPVNSGNTHSPVVDDGALVVRPGVYLLLGPGATATSNLSREFYAPATSLKETVVLHTPAVEATAGAPSEVRAQIVSVTPPDSVWLIATRVGGFDRIPPVRLQAGSAFDFSGSFVARRPGRYRYRITVFEAGHATTFPGSAAGMPWDWNFTGLEAWELDVVAAEVPLVLFDAARDHERLLYPSRWMYVPFVTDLVPGRQPGDLAIRAEVRDFEPSPHHFALRSHLPEPFTDRLGTFTSGSTLRVVARTSGRPNERVEIAITMTDGSAWGAMIDLTNEWREVTISRLAPIDLILLPRPYPAFPPYRFRSSGGAETLDWRMLDGLQFSIGAEHVDATDATGPHGFEIQRVTLDR